MSDGRPVAARPSATRAPDFGLVGANPARAVENGLAEAGWSGHVGPIHEVVREDRLRAHVNPRAVASHLCGPPMRAGASRRMLGESGAPQVQIAHDAF